MEAYRQRVMGELPGEAARRWGDREALVFGDRRWTHRDFAEEVEQVAKGLVGIGVVLRKILRDEALRGDEETQGFRAWEGKMTFIKNILAFKKDKFSDVE